MNPEPLFLGLDVGTQGTKALLVDRRGRVVGRAARSYALLPAREPGAAEQHPDTWIDAIRACCAELRDGHDFGRVASVGVSGQQHGAVLLDDAGAVVRAAKLWCDTSTAAEAADLERELGRAVPVGFTASKVRYVARREPRLFDRVATVFLPHDYVNFRLTGVRAMEAGDASGTGYFDPVARAFDVAAQHAIDPRLPARTPPLLAVGERCGEVNADGADLTGLRVGTPVAAGSGDNMCSAIGAGAFRDGIAVMSLGTSGTVFAHASSPVIDPCGEIALFCGAAGGYLPLLCIMNCTAVFEEVRALCGATDDAGRERLIAEAELAPAGCDGMLFVPFLVGERVPAMPHATGSLLGVRLGSLRRGPLARAALEGVACNLALGVERLRALGVAASSFRAVGGGAKNPFWLRILASLLESTITPLVEPESAALGAALLAKWTFARESGRAIGIAEALADVEFAAAAAIEPDAAIVATYRDLRARFASARAVSIPSASPQRNP